MQTFNTQLNSNKANTNHNHTVSQISDIVRDVQYFVPNVLGIKLLKDNSISSNVYMAIIYGLGPIYQNNSGSWGIIDATIDLNKPFYLRGPSTQQYTYFHVKFENYSSNPVSVSSNVFASLGFYSGTIGGSGGPSNFLCFTSGTNMIPDEMDCIIYNFTYL